MFQFLAMTQAGCRRSFPRHLLHRITTQTILVAAVVLPQLIYTQPLPAEQASRPNIVLIMADDHGEQLAQQWYDDKTSMMVDVLGKEHDIVMHAIIPYAVGGGLDLYYFTNGIAGTAIATKELCEVT